MRGMFKPLTDMVLLLGKRVDLFGALTILYAGFIFYLSSLPTIQAPLIVAIPSFFKHVAEYSVFGFLLLASLRASNYDGKEALILAVVVASLYGVTDEIHQYFVPGRFFSYTDVLADFLGSLFAIVSKPRIEKVREI